MPQYLKFPQSGKTERQFQKLFQCLKGKAVYKATNFESHGNKRMGHYCCLTCVKQCLIQLWLRGKSCLDLDWKKIQCSRQYFGYKGRTLNLASYSVWFWKVRSVKTYYFDKARKALKSFCIWLSPVRKNVITTQISLKDSRNSSFLHSNLSYSQAVCTLLFP